MALKTLSNRYEVIERIGGGGMAIVYRGRDLLLHRQVAVKVLRQQFVNDEEFIKRFRREAQAAASLSHPNIVSVYDVGQEEDIHFIVMEYVEGINLNDKIKSEAPLSVEESVNIAGQICDALDHAHHHQVIHRDIKPHNILIGQNGRVKVTDFGIARAATSTDVTQTGAVLGSVHYFSPEHAKGVAQGPESDLYSLGVVLYQMLTNQLPFTGESPISVALKHIQEDCISPKELNDLIPQSVENIVLKSLRKSVSERYKDANTMLIDLNQSLHERMQDVDKITFDSDNLEDMDKTVVLPGLKLDPILTTPSATFTSSTPIEAEDELPEQKPKKWNKPIIWASVSVGIVLLAFLLFNLTLNKLSVKEVTVPDITNMTLSEAKIALESKDLRIGDVEEKVNEDIEPGIIISQENKNIRVKINTPINVVVSKGGEKAAMKDYVGQLWDDVYADLQNSNVPDDQIEKVEVLSDKPEGTVLKQTPAANDTYDPANTVFQFRISKGTGAVTMKNVIGLKETVAVSMLEAEDFKVNVIYETNYSIQKGYVSDQAPFKGGEQVDDGTTITLTVSSGYPSDALMPTKQIDVSPKASGTSSTIRIVYSDARGDDQEWGTRTITSKTTYPISVIVSPTKNAEITYYVDGVVGNTYTITYQDAQSQNAPKPTQ
jgi:serine/threonine-protein kinase